VQVNEHPNITKSPHTTPTPYITEGLMRSRSVPPKTSALVSNFFMHILSSGGCPRKFFRVTTRRLAQTLSEVGSRYSRAFLNCIKFFSLLSSSSPGHLRVSLCPQIQSWFILRKRSVPDPMYVLFPCLPGSLFSALRLRGGEESPYPWRVRLFDLWGGGFSVPWRKRWQS